MQLVEHKDLRDGSVFLVRFSLASFTEEEIYCLAKHGPVHVDLDAQEYFHPSVPIWMSGPRRVELLQLPEYTFRFSGKGFADIFLNQTRGRVKAALEVLLNAVKEFVGEDVFEIRAGEEIRRISEGARKAIDPNSPEFQEVIEKNREAFAKLSQL